MIYLSKKERSIVPQIFNSTAIKDESIELNLAESPFPPTSQIKKLFQTFDTSNLSKYCSKEQNLSEIASEKFGLESENVLVCNGIDNALALCFATFFDPNDSLVLSEACNGEYRSLMHHHEIVHRKIEVGKDAKNKVQDYFDIDGARGILICNPNFPTSQMISRLDMVDIIEKNSDRIVIVDESFGEFANCSVINFIEKFPNLVVLKSFSKAYGLAGIRCGLVLGNKVLIDALKQMQKSLCYFPDDTVSQKIVSEAIKDEKYLSHCVDKILKTRADFSDKLIDLGFEVLPSHTNFVLAKSTRKLPSEIAFQLKENNIIVKTFKTQKISDYLLISIGNDEQMNKVCDVLKKILK